MRTKAKAARERSGRRERSVGVVTVTESDTRLQPRLMACPLISAANVSHPCSSPNGPKASVAVGGQVWNVGMSSPQPAVDVVFFFGHSGLGGYEPPPAASLSRPGVGPRARLFFPLIRARSIPPSSLQAAGISLINSSPAPESGENLPRRTSSQRLAVF